MAYFYLVTQLPYLRYGQGTWMTAAHFVDLCQTQLNAADAALLPYCTLGVNSAEESRRIPSSFITKWRKRERVLTLNLAKARAARLKRDVSIEPPHENHDAEQQALAALEMNNPLEAELFIDQGRWNAIEELVGTDSFGVNVIYAYLLKLRLLERRSLFKTEEGFAEYKALYAEILKSAPRAGA